MRHIRNIFVSKPNALSGGQAAFWAKLRQLLRQRDLQPRTLGETDFPNCTPIQAVREVVSICQGALILGFKQLRVENGVLKEDTPHQKIVTNYYLPTAWNHIEAGMAFMADLPLMIIRESGVATGVFDPGITDRFIHQADIDPEWLDSEPFRQPFGEWCGEVLKREPARSIAAYPTPEVKP